MNSGGDQGALRRAARAVGNWLLARVNSDPSGHSDTAAALTVHEDAHADPAVRERAIGRGVAHLLTNRSWVHRRTEYVRFVDADTVQRQMGVDFTLPLDRHAEALYRLCPGVVPLATLEKRKLADFSLWDEDGRRVPMLNTEQDAYFAAAALIATARGTARVYGIDAVPEPINTLLREVASRPQDEAAIALAALRGEGVALGSFDRIGLGDLVKPFSEYQPLAAQLLAGPSGPEPPDPKTEAAKQWRKRHQASRALDSLAEQLHSQFMVLAQLRGDASDLRARRLLKFAYEQPPHSYRPKLGLLRRVHRAGLEVLASLNWWPKTVTLGSLAVGSAASFHVEVVAPEDIELTGARLVSKDPGRADSPAQHRESDGTEQQRVHFHISGAPRAAAGLLWLQMRAARREFFNAALVSASLIAVLLVLGIDRLDEVAAPQKGSSLEAAATLLIAIPGLVSAYLLRPGEHLMASRLLFGPRVLLLASAACAFAAAGALAGAYETATRDAIWHTAAKLSLGVLAALVVSYLVPMAVPLMRRARRAIGGWIARGWSWVKAKMMGWWSSVKARALSGWHRGKRLIHRQPGS